VGLLLAAILGRYFGHHLPAFERWVESHTVAGFVVFVLALVVGTSLFVEVYFGYTAKHLAKLTGQVSEHSSLHTVLTITGLMLCVALLAHVLRLARRALAGVVSFALLCAGLAS
jgi:hypothetical protein